MSRIVTYEHIQASIDTSKQSLKIVGAEALNPDGSLNMAYLENTGIEVPEDGEIDLDRVTFNNTVAYHRGYLEKRTKLEYLAGKEKMKESVGIRIGKKQYEMGRVALCGQGVGITGDEKTKAFREEGCMAAVTIVGTGILDNEEAVLRDYYGVNESDLYEKDIAFMNAIVRKQKEVQSNVPIAVNILLAGGGALEYVDAAIDAGVDIILCGAGNPLPAAQLIAKKIEEKGGELDVGFCPIFNDPRTVNAFLKKSLLPYGIIPPIIQFEDPGRSGGHEPNREGNFNDDSYQQQEEFFKLFTKVKEEIAELILSGKQKIPSWMNKEDAARRVRGILAMSAGGVSSHEEACLRLGAGADIVGVATSADNTVERDADRSFGLALERGFDANGDIQTSHKHTRELTYIKSPAGYPAHTLWSSFPRQLFVLNQGMKLVNDTAQLDPKTLKEQFLAKKRVEFEAEGKDKDEIDALLKKLETDQKNYIQPHEISDDTRSLLLKLFEYGEQIPGWHYTITDFINRTRGVLKKCKASCLTDCGPTSPLIFDGKPAASRDCILGPLSRAYHADGMTYWEKRSPMRNIDLGLFFSGSEASALIEPTTQELVHYLKTGNLPSGIINPVRSVTDHTFMNMWNEKPGETIARIEAL